MGPPSKRVFILVPSARYQVEFCRLDQQARIEPDLLVGRGAEVVVGEDGAQGPVDPVVVQQRVGVPELDGGLGAVPVLAGRRRAEDCRRTPTS